MLSKFLIQFSVDRSNYDGGNEDNFDFLQKSHAPIAALSSPNSTAGHHQSTAYPETPGHSWASLGQSLLGSPFLSPGFQCTQVLFQPSEHLW